MKWHAPAAVFIRGFHIFASLKPKLEAMLTKSEYKKKWKKYEVNTVISRGKYGMLGMFFIFGTPKTEAPNPEPRPLEFRTSILCEYKLKKEEEN